MRVKGMPTLFAVAILIIHFAIFSFHIDFITWGLDRHNSISTMNTAGPTTRPARSFYKLRTRPLDPVASRPRFLSGDDPADPLIAREWRNIFPRCSRRRRLN